MNLRDLEYVAAVADLGHFGTAAERCFVTQPTLSGQVRKLEEELGYPLFERSTRRVVPTTFGREVLPLVRRILADCGELTRKAKELEDPFAGTLTLGAFPTLCPWFFPRLAPFFKEAYPKTVFHLVEDKSQGLQKRLCADDLDAAVLALPQELRGVDALPLFSESFLATVPAEHPWGKRERVDVEELAGQKLLLLDDGHCLRDQALDLCRRYGGGEDASFRATSLETLRQMVRLGQGITLMPRLAVPDGYDEGANGLRYLPFSSAEARRDLALCFRASHPRRRFFLDFASRVRGLCGTGLPVIPLF